MRLLDRYVLQNFLIPFFYSTCGFLAIWLVFDLSDKGHDFIEAHVKLKTLAYFYLTQFPQILVICLPVGLLLALLYSLSRMSRSNEIISMLTAGRSVLRVMLPLSTAAVATNVVLSFIWSWNNFLWPLIITRSQDMQTLPLGLARFLSYMEDTTGALYAFVIMVLAPGLLVFLMAQSAFMRGLTTGATKG